MSPGVLFVLHMIDLTVGLRRAHHRNRLTKVTEHDITVWLDFLSTFNGRSFFFTMTHGTHLLSLSCIRTRPDQRVRVLYWASVGSLALFLIRGNLLISPF